MVSSKSIIRWPGWTLLLVVVATASVSAQERRRIVREGVVVSYRAEDDDLANEIVRALPSMLADIAANLDMVVPPEVEVFVCDDHEEVGRFIRGEIPSWMAAIAQPSKSRIFIAKERLPPGNRPELVKVLRHEAAHVIFGSMPAWVYRKIPLWFHEGVAQKFAASLFEFDWNTLARHVQVWESPSLSDLTDRFPADQRDAQIAYLYSEAIVRLMMRMWGSDVIERILVELPNVDSFSEAVVNVTRHPIVWHEKQLHEEIASDRSVYASWLYGFFGSVIFLSLVPLLLAAVYRARKKKEERYAEWDREDLAYPSGNDSWPTS